MRMDTACLHGEPACKECAPHLGNAKQFDWRAEASLTLEVKKESSVLRIVVAASRGQWLAIALETPESAQEIEAVFGNHAHKLVGTYDDMLRAVEAAEAFSRCWLRGTKSTRLGEKCNCEEIQ